MRMHRRDFLKAGAAGAAFAASPAAPPWGPARRRRASLSLGAASAAPPRPSTFRMLDPSIEGGADRAQRGVHLVPDLQHGAGRVPHARRHHHALFGASPATA
jgi:hypothetical protein